MRRQWAWRYDTAQRAHVHANKKAPGASRRGLVPYLKSKRTQGLSCHRIRLGRLRQLLGHVGLFPRELRLVAAEMTARRRLAEDGPTQVEVLDDARGREREQVAHQFADAAVFDLARAFG